MSATVMVCSDRNGFRARWQPLLERLGLSVESCDPDDLGSSLRPGAGVVVDAAALGNDEDELLATVGYVRALGGVAVVQVAESGPGARLDDVVEEMCAGLIVRNAEDAERQASNLARRLDGDRDTRFEFVTLSPRDGEVLAILGSGRSVLLRRPIRPEDDESEVVAIVLAEDASTATLELASGGEVRLRADDLTPTVPTSKQNGSSGATIPIDGTRLGARLRELRLEAGLTQAELARRTGIHRPNIARVEAGRHTPSLETLARLASAMGVPTTRVLSED